MFFVYAYVFYFCYRWIIRVKCGELVDWDTKKREQKSKSRTDSESIFPSILLDVIVSISRRLEFI